MKKSKIPEIVIELSTKQVQCEIRKINTDFVAPSLDEVELIDMTSDKIKSKVERLLINQLKNKMS